MADIVCSIVLYNHGEEDILPLANELLASENIKKLVFVDNGGSEWVKKWVSERVAYLNPGSNIGYGAGHNMALREFGHEGCYYLVSNPDISLDAKSLSILREEIELLDVGLIIPDIRYLDGRRQEACKLLPTPLNLFVRRFLPALAQRLDHSYMMRDIDFTRPVFAPFLSGCFMFFRTEALRAVNGFDERYFMYMEDIDLSRRVAERFGAMYTPRTTIYHGFQKGSYTDKRLLRIHIRSAFLYFNKWGWIFDRSRWKMNKKARAQFRKNNV
ncbi:glycosyltransferase family 2 protein [uncultured Comamonas sp.]|uniref:glycosyltransferase family 2 protein n=1 Tax=uncultured Comamonas sp. TaxID=114710 RepID=UPI0025DB11CB|nr:glycosyltransferase family 2 protein [uncultured Comamonas sp.]